MKLVISISFFLCIAVTSICAQDSTSTSPNIKKKIKEPIIKNLKDIQAEIAIKSGANGDMQFIECFITAVKNIQIGEICYEWMFKPLLKVPIIGKYNENEFPNNPDWSIKLSDLKGGWTFLTGIQLLETIKANPELFSTDKKSKIQSYSLYYYDYTTKEIIYEIKSGITPFKISFSLSAKCGFIDKNDLPQYPDTLYEGTLIKDFYLENKEGKLSITYQRKDEK